MTPKRVPIEHEKSTFFSTFTSGENFFYYGNNDFKSINGDVYFTYMRVRYDNMCVEILVYKRLFITLITSKNVIFVVDGNGAFMYTQNPDKKEQYK